MPEQYTMSQQNYPEQPKSCPICGGSMHEPCPFREEAEKQVDDRERERNHAYRFALTGDWNSDREWREWYHHFLVRQHARSLRLADEAREEKVKRAHLALENAALRQRVQEQEAKAQHWYEAWQNQDAENVSLKQRFEMKEQRVKELEEELKRAKELLANTVAPAKSLPPLNEEEVK